MFANLFYPCTVSCSLIMSDGDVEMLAEDAEIFAIDIEASTADGEGPHHLRAVLQNLQRRSAEFQFSLSESPLPALAVNIELEDTIRDKSRAVEAELQTNRQNAINQIEQLLNNVKTNHPYMYYIPIRTKKNVYFDHELRRHVMGKGKKEVKYVAPSFMIKPQKGQKSSVHTTVILETLLDHLRRKIPLPKRGVLYRYGCLFDNQSQSDPIIDDVSALLSSSRSKLNLISSPMGVLTGNLSYYEGGHFTNCDCYTARPVPTDITMVHSIKSTAGFILLIEKETILLQLALTGFHRTYNCLMVSGKGQPDVPTRLLLNRLQSDLRLPVVTLYDCNPYGIEIMAVFKYGSCSMSFDSAQLVTPEIRWLGVKPSDLEKHNVPSWGRKELTARDRVKIEYLLNLDLMKYEPDWCKELMYMRDKGQKAEIEGISSEDIAFLMNYYLPEKFGELQTFSSRHGL